MTERPRILWIGPGDVPATSRLFPEADVEQVTADAAVVSQRLQQGGFAAVVGRPEVLNALLDQFQRDELILQHIDKGLAIVDSSGRILWTNRYIESLAGGAATGRPLLEALGATVCAVGTSVDRGSIATLSWQMPSQSRVEDPLGPARRGQPTQLRLWCPQRPDQPYLEADIRPVIGPQGNVDQMIVLVRNVTPEVIQQQKLDALHQAGRELAGLSPEQLAEMNVRSRIELLKQNLRQSIHNLLHYDTIEVRLLDRQTGELIPLLQDGMLPEAAGRKLYARPSGNGVTGYVAYTGQSYLCPDTTKDPLYLSGAAGARSSMTVPLKFHDEVIGTLNVESPQVNAFGPEDLQFAELFSKEIAAALHTLDLLSAQQICTASQSIEAVNKQIALPLDEVVAGASVLMEQLRATHPELHERAERLREAARAVREGVSHVERHLLASPLSGQQPAPLAGKRVLVIDADEQMRRQAHMVFSRLGATVETAATAADGIAMARTTPYDAIIQEVKPTDMGGYDCYRRLREVCPRAVVAMSTGFGYDTAHSILKARADGMKHVLFKPFRQDQIVQLFRDATPQSPPPTAATTPATPQAVAPPNGGA